MAKTTFNRSLLATLLLASLAGAHTAAIAQEGKFWLRLPASYLDNAPTPGPGGSGGGVTPPQVPSYLMRFQDVQLPVAGAKRPYSIDLSHLLSITAAGGAQAVGYSKVVWAIASGQLPEGLSLSGSILSGTPAKATTSVPFELVATYEGVQEAHTYAVSVDESVSLELQASSLPDATRGRPYTSDFWSLLSVTGGGDERVKPNEVTWSIGQGALPQGLALVGSKITGTPTSVTGGETFQVVATYLDATGETAYTLKVSQALLKDVKQIAAGNMHTCVVTTAGAVKCWGYNVYGQLGNGTTAYSAVPVDVVGLGSGVASISSEGYLTCAITTGGAVKCWGLNDTYQLGDGTNKNSPVPVDVMGLNSGVVSVTTGTHHACALMNSGGVKCWGNNGVGQLARERTPSNSAQPLDIEGLPAAIASVQAGGSHTCVLTTGGAAFCWGSNYYGQLGDGKSNPNSPVPGQVYGLGSGVASLSLGEYHTCAVTTAGAAKCWGFNGQGQLGYGNTVTSSIEYTLPGLSTGALAVSP